MAQLIGPRRSVLDGPDVRRQQRIAPQGPQRALDPLTYYCAPRATVTLDASLEYTHMAPRNKLRHAAAALGTHPWAQCAIDRRRGHDGEYHWPCFAFPHRSRAWGDWTEGSPRPWGPVDSNRVPGTVSWARSIRPEGRGMPPQVALSPFSPFPPFDV
ncbi:hypothetical protein VUR80DRAFT_1553 [Thermomyces stellatus]